MVAELGKAKHVGITELRPGMKVHQDVVGYKDKILINAGEVLSRKHISQLQKWEKKDKPLGPALPRKNPEDNRERIQHAEWQGGWRPSHFNPHGVLVSATLASGDEVPAVEKDPTLSPVVQNSPRKSFNVGEVGVESPLIREMELKAEIRTLEKLNAQLGGNIHTVIDTFTDENSLLKRKEDLTEQNSELIGKLKVGGNGNESLASGGQDVDRELTIKRRGRPPKKR